MSKFSKKRGASTPEISTASLPDIIFMLLFFFMVVTVMKDSSLKVKVTVPDATELEKLERKSLVHYIYVGAPLPQFQAQYGTAPRMQLNDQFATIDDIPLFLEQEKIKVNEKERDFITTSLRVDREATMGIVSDVKTKLRKSNQLRLNYSARLRTGDL
ncbi:MAG: biopolymer transporter ExbD [Saprospiraceae bacterium]|nr:biopolymer transporter ExbD [Saprospiraceae bacterium]